MSDTIHGISAGAAVEITQGPAWLTTWGKFIDDNDGAEEFAEIAAALLAGQTYHGGGGASAEWSIRLLAEGEGMKRVMAAIADSLKKQRLKEALPMDINHAHAALNGLIEAGYTVVPVERSTLGTTRDAELGAVTAAIRLELDVLLADYSGDEALHRNDDPDTERGRLAQARLDAMDWLRENWSNPNESDIARVAKAALAAAAKARA